MRPRASPPANRRSTQVAHDDPLTVQSDPPQESRQTHSLVQRTSYQADLNIKTETQYSDRANNLL